MAAATNFKVFYTKHKNRKHKVWQDGFLKLAHGLNMHKIYLFDFEEREIDCTYISKKVIITEGTELESQQYLIIIEETMNLKAPKSPPGRVQASLNDSSWTRGSNVCDSHELYPEGNESVNKKRSIRDIMELIITNDSNNKRTKPTNGISKGEDVLESQQGKLVIDNSKVYKEHILEPPKCNFWIPNTSPGKKMVKGQSRWSSFLHPPSPPPFKPWSLLTEKAPESFHKSLTTTTHVCVQPSLNQQLSPHSLSSPSSPILPLSSSHSGISSITNTSERSLFIPSDEEPPIVDQSKPKARDSLIRFLKPRIAIAEEHVLISPSRSLFLHPPTITHSSSGSSSKPQSPSLYYATKPATTPATISLLTSSTASPLKSPVVLSSRGEIGYCTDAVSDYDVFDTAGAIPTVCQEVPCPLSRMKDVRSRDCFEQPSLGRETITITVDDEVHPDRILGKINTAQTFSSENASEDYRNITSTALAPIYHQTKTMPFKDDNHQGTTKSSTSCSLKPLCYDNSKPSPYPWQPGGVEASFGSFPMQPGDALSRIAYNKKGMSHSQHLAPYKLLPCQRGSLMECFSKKVTGQAEIINPVRGSEYQVNSAPVPHANSTDPTINRISNDSFAIEDITINCHSVSTLSSPSLPPLFSPADSIRAGLNGTTQHSIQNEVKSMAQNNDSHSIAPSSTGSIKGSDKRYKFILSDPKIDDISLIKKNPGHFKLGLWDI
uniref:5'-3' DNA helicase ZGRF1-like N-terminal domain-containing protein n=1 Tax=Amphimedon queenslandica TaxID=400682 RepID=A0A1X7VVM7_AMPQE